MPAPARPADLVHSPPYDRVELDHAVAFLRGDRQPWHYRKPANMTRAAWSDVVATETELRAALVALTGHWRAIAALTPRQVSVLLAYAVEGNIARAAARLGISDQTVKNHITAMRKRIYGGAYAEMIGQSTSSAPLIALAVRWALEADARDLDSGALIGTDRPGAGKE